MQELLERVELIDTAHDAICELVHPPYRWSGRVPPEGECFCRDRFMGYEFWAGIVQNVDFDATPPNELPPYE